jgi:chloramphenicol 3-O phosphotransferase
MSTGGPATVVLVNGVGSSGKSSIARALQGITSTPFLHVAMDAFLDMLPEALLDHPDGYRFETILEAGKPSVVIHEGPAGARLMLGMRGSVVALAAAGSNLIVDDVLIDGELGDYRVLLSPFRLVVVGVHAPLDVLEAREAARGDRMRGLARWQFGRVHRAMQYDLELDTSSANDCAEAIRARFGL